MTSKFKTECRCGEPMFVNQNTKSYFCEKCDRAPVSPADDMKEFGYSLEAYAKGICQIFEELNKLFVKQCQGGCGRSFPKSEMHSGIWCSECYETKEETN